MALVHQMFYLLINDQTFVAVPTQFLRILALNLRRQWIFLQRQKLMQHRLLPIKASQTTKMKITIAEFHRRSVFTCHLSFDHLLKSRCKNTCRSSLSLATQRLLTTKCSPTKSLPPWNALLPLHHPPSSSNYQLKQCKRLLLLKNMPRAAASQPSSSRNRPAPLVRKKARLP